MSRYYFVFQFYLMDSIKNLALRNIITLLECFFAPGSFKQVQPLFIPIIRNHRINTR